MQEKSIYEDDIFKIPFDVVKLPSESKLYGGSIPPAIEVEYVTTADEDTLYSDNMGENGSVFDILIGDKIKDKSISVESLLIGDYNEILMFLRKSMFKNIYYANTFDPDTNTYVKAPVDIDLLKRKPIGSEFDENGEFEFHLKNMNKRITFKLLTVGMSNLINTTAQANKKTNGAIPYIVTRLAHQIMSVDGIRDKLYIKKFANIMNPQDRVDFMTYSDKISPGVDLTYEFESTIKKTKYTDKVILSIDFFYPKGPISKE